MRGSGDGKRSFYDWHLLKPEKAGKGGVQPAILEVTYIREKNPTLIMRRLISEKQNSVIHGDLYQLEIIIRWLILGEKHPVIQKVINFREGWWGEGKGEVDLTQKPRNLTSTYLIG